MIRQYSALNLISAQLTFIQLSSHFSEEVLEQLKEHHAKASVSVNFQSRTYELLEVLKAERALMQGIGYKGAGRVKGVNGVGVTQRQGNCCYSRGTGCWLDITKLLPPRDWSSQSRTYCCYYLDHHYHGYSTKRMVSTFLLPSNLS